MPQAGHSEVCVLSGLLYHVGDFPKERRQDSQERRCVLLEVAVYQSAVFTFWFGVASVLRARVIFLLISREGTCTTSIAFPAPWCRVASGLLSLCLHLV